MQCAINHVPFIFLRHGETSWNALGLAQGRTDVSLSEKGHLQAIRAATYLAGVQISRIVSSPLSRAFNTATTVGKNINLDVEIDPDLQEANFGIEEGKHGLSWYSDWMNGSFTPDGGESFADLALRATRAVNRATSEPSSAGFVLIVGHGAWFRALRYAMGIEPNIRPPNGMPTMCSPPGLDRERWSVSSMLAGET